MFQNSHINFLTRFNGKILDKGETEHIPSGFDMIEIEGPKLYENKI